MPKIRLLNATHATFKSKLRPKPRRSVHFVFPERFSFPGGTGHMSNSKNSEFLKRKWNLKDSSGGTLRNTRAGRRQRPIVARAPIHLVMKADRACIAGGLRTTRRFLLIHRLRDRYAKRFFIRVEQMSVQGDHIHLIVRTTRRSTLQSFLRVFAGQVAQQFEHEGLVKLGVTDTLTSRVSKLAARAPAKRERQRKLWLHRPFTRVVRGRRALVTLQNYVQLNEKEAQGAIPYRKERLRGLSSYEWRILWT